MKNNYRDNYYGSILDPLHGDIKLSEIEKWCIAQPIFSRLRNVKQNTFLYYVFPSANHTRFEHSIGVMHLAGRIFDACRENYVTGIMKKLKNNEDPKSSFFDLDTLEEKEELYYQELRLAALLHDLGHGPLSHLFDKFAITAGNFMKIVEAEKVLQNYAQGFQELISSGEGKVEHEIISCAFVFYLVDELKEAAKTAPQKFSASTVELIDKISSERIVKLIEPKFKGLEELTDSKGNNYSLFFSRIITAFPLDADRMDYLWRDSYFSGVTYGIYDVNRLFASFIASIEGNNVLLTYKESGLDAMLRFIQSRSHLYNQVYFHKTNRAANTMLEYATASKKSKGDKLLDQYGTLPELLDFYIQNGDNYFMHETVKGLADNAVEQEVLEELTARRLFKRIFEVKIVLSKTESGQVKEVKDIHKEINSKLKALEMHRIYATSDKYENETYKDWSDKPVAIAKKKGEKYEIVQSWDTIGKEFELANMNVMMVRVYLKRNFKTSDEFNFMKNKVDDLIHEEIEQLKKIAR